MNPARKTVSTICAGLLLLTLLSMAPFAWSQDHRNGAPPAAPQLDTELFPPDLVMRFQREIGLTEKQSSTILDAVRSTQSQMIEVQWTLSPELEGLRKVISQARIDEGDVLDRLERITTLENQAKRLQILLMVRVKNALSPEQQQKLRELR